MRALGFDKLPKRHQIVENVEDPEMTVGEASELLYRQN